MNFLILILIIAQLGSLLSVEGAGYGQLKDGRNDVVKDKKSSGIWPIAGLFKSSIAHSSDNSESIFIKQLERALYFDKEYPRSLPVNIRGDLLNFWRQLTKCFSFKKTSIKATTNKWYGKCRGKRIPVESYLLEFNSKFESRLLDDYDLTSDYQVERQEVLDEAIKVLAKNKQYSTVNKYFPRSGYNLDNIRQFFNKEICLDKEVVGDQFEIWKKLKFSREKAFRMIYQFYLERSKVSEDPNTLMELFQNAVRIWLNVFDRGWETITHVLIKLQNNVAFHDFLLEIFKEYTDMHMEDTRLIWEALEYETNESKFIVDLLFVQAHLLSNYPDLINTLMIKYSNEEFDKYFFKKVESYCANNDLYELLFTVMQQMIQHRCRDNQPADIFKGSEPVDKERCDILLNLFVEETRLSVKQKWLNETAATPRENSRQAMILAAYIPVRHVLLEPMLKSVLDKSIADSGLHKLSKDITYYISQAADTLDAANINMAETMVNWIKTVKVGETSRNMYENTKLAEYLMKYVEAEELVQVVQHLDKNFDYCQFTNPQAMVTRKLVKLLLLHAFNHNIMETLKELQEIDITLSQFENGWLSKEYFHNSDVYSPAIVDFILQHKGKTLKPEILDIMSPEQIEIHYQALEEIVGDQNSVLDALKENPMNSINQRSMWVHIHSVQSKGVKSSAERLAKELSNRGYLYLFPNFENYCAHEKFFDQPSNKDYYFSGDGYFFDNDQYFANHEHLPETGSSLNHAKIEYPSVERLTFQLEMDDALSMGDAKVIADLCKKVELTTDEVKSFINTALELRQENSLMALIKGCGQDGLFEYFVRSNNAMAIQMLVGERVSNDLIQTLVKRSELQLYILYSLESVRLSSNQLLQLFKKFQPDCLLLQSILRRFYSKDTSKAENKVLYSGIMKLRHIDAKCKLPMLKHVVGKSKMLKARLFMFRLRNFMLL